MSANKRVFSSQSELATALVNQSCFLFQNLRMRVENPSKLWRHQVKIGSNVEDLNSMTIHLNLIFSLFLSSFKLSFLSFYLHLNFLFSLFTSQQISFSVEEICHICLDIQGSIHKWRHPYLANLTTSVTHFKLYPSYCDVIPDCSLVTIFEFGFSSWDLNNSLVRFSKVCYLNGDWVADKIT